MALEKLFRVSRKAGRLVGVGVGATFIRPTLDRWLKEERYNIQEEVFSQTARFSDGVPLRGVGTTWNFDLNGPVPTHQRVIVQSENDLMRSSKNSLWGMGVCTALAYAANGYWGFTDDLPVVLSSVVPLLFGVSVGSFTNSLSLSYEGKRRKKRSFST